MVRAPRAPAVAEIRTQQAISLKTTPDLIIFNPNKKEIHFVEVKCCRSDKDKLDFKMDTQNYSNCYPNTVFYIISCEGILEVPVAVFDESREIDMAGDEIKNRFNVLKNSSFKLRPTVIEQLQDLASKLFLATPNNSF